MIIKCTCEQAYQDEQFGQGHRRHSWDDKAGKDGIVTGAWVCSVCGNAKSGLVPFQKTRPKK